MLDFSGSLPQVFSGLSECKGVQDYGHRLFLTTNEEGQDSTLEKLSRHELNGDTIVGVSGFFILNAASCRGITSEHSREGIRNIIVLDKSIPLEDFWENTVRIVKTSSDRFEVADRIEKLLMDKRKLYYGYNCCCDGCLQEDVKSRIRRLRCEITSGQSWLSSDLRFERIKRIFGENRFVFKRVDLCDSATVHDIASRMRACGMKLDMVYLSNVREYAEDDGYLAEFRQSLNPLVSSDGFLVDTKPREGSLYNRVKLTQRVSRRRKAAIATCFPASPGRKRKLPQKKQKFYSSSANDIAKIFKHVKAEDFLAALSEE